LAEPIFYRRRQKNAAQLAQLKGQMEAIQQASIQKNCGIQFRQAQQERRRQLLTAVKNNL